MDLRSVRREVLQHGRTNVVLGMEGSEESLSILYVTYADRVNGRTL